MRRSPPATISEQAPTLRLLGILLMAALPLGSAWADTLPRLPGQQDYGKARQSLQKQGWKPVTLPGADACQPADGRCAGRPEMFACAGSGLGQCLFTWRRGRTVVEVVTVGEDKPVVSLVRCRDGCR